MEPSMKIRLISALAVLALAPLSVSAYAEPAPAEFRTAAPQAFSAEDLQRYGLTAEEAARGEALQAQGAQILALSPEEADAYRAGQFSQTTWILIGVGVLVIIAVL
jgi:hypothetical protein